MWNIKVSALLHPARPFQQEVACRLLMSWPFFKWIWSYCYPIFAAKKTLARNKELFYWKISQLLCSMSQTVPDIGYIVNQYLINVECYFASLGYWRSGQGTKLHQLLLHRSLTLWFHDNVVTWKRPLSYCPFGRRTLGIRGFSSWKASNQSGTDFLLITRGSGSQFETPWCWCRIIVIYCNDKSNRSITPCIMLPLYRCIFGIYTIINCHDEMIWQGIWYESWKDMYFGASFRQHFLTDANANFR